MAYLIHKEHNTDRGRKKTIYKVHATNKPKATEQSRGHNKNVTIKSNDN